MMSQNRRRCAAACLLLVLAMAGCQHSVSLQHAEPDDHLAAVAGEEMSMVGQEQASSQNAPLSQPMPVQSRFSPGPPTSLPSIYGQAVTRAAAGGGQFGQPTLPALCAPASAADASTLRVNPVWRPVGYLRANELIAEQEDQRGRFAIPEVLPGSDAPPLQLPPFDPDQTPSERRAAFEGVFSPLTPLPPESNVPDETTGQKFTLDDLQQIAFDNSPVIRRAAADLEAARGLAVQAGAYPNPAVGYIADTANTGRTAGYQGGFIAQEVVTGKKLQLARGAAEMEAFAAEYALQRAQVNLISDVRRGYFAVLVAQRRVELMRALAQLSGDAYKAFIDLVAGGEAAAYEPLQFRVFALQARNKVVHAENEYLAAWRQLAATVGMPDLSPGRVEGTLDEAAPQVDYYAALAHLLNCHTDLAIANVRIDRAALNLRLQQVTPLPNVDVEAAVTYDDTSPLNDIAYSLQIGLPLPVFNKNRGNIAAGEAELMGAHQDWSRIRNELIALLAEAHANYASSRTIAEAYRGEIIREQVRTYRGIYDRFRQAGDNLDFSQVVLAQQTLFEVVDQYLTALDAQWQALVDLARVLQLEELSGMEGLAPAVDDPPQAAENP